MAEVESRVVEPMATNMTVENTSPSLKRKSDEDDAKLLRDSILLPKKMKPEPPSSDTDDIEVVKVVKSKSIKSDTSKETTSQTERKNREGTSTSTTSRRSASPVKKSKLSAEEQEAARLKKEEKEAEKEAKRAEKEAQKAEREAVKAKRDAEKAEKDALKAEKEADKAAKKEAAQKALEAQQAKHAKQSSFLTNFLQKKSATPLISRDSPAGPSSAPNRSVSPEKESEYRRTFREVPKRANYTWASVNRWSEEESPAEEISSEDLEEWGRQGSSKVSGWSSKDFLKEHLSRHNIASSSTSRPTGLKSAPSYKAVSEVWSAYLEADDPRKVLRQLKSRDKFPFKTLAFDQQDRPPYRGTWTKSSSVVGPRTPFAQDPIFDYSYDSADEWEEEEGGEDVDDPEEGGGSGEEEDDEGTEAGEFDDWLDDSEDAQFGPTDADVEMAETPEQAKLPLKVVKKLKPRKKIVKLTPTWDGPLWESDVGRGNAGFEEYRIQLLNETPSSLDPFTYTSSDPPQAFKTTYGVASMGLNSSVKCLLASKPIAPPKEIPTPAPAPKDVAIKAEFGAATTSTTSNGTTTSTPAKSRPAAPKIVFPALYLPQLLKIVQGSTKSRGDLLAELKNEFGTVTSKAAIEAKLKEVATRNGVKKDSKWIINPEVLSAEAVPKPPNDMRMEVDSSTF